METTPLPEGWTQGMRVRLMSGEEIARVLPNSYTEEELADFKEEFGQLLSDDVCNGTVVVEIEERYLTDDHDDGLRECPIEIVEKTNVRECED